ncbi:MAG: potassium transporter Kup [Acidimicrobiia bacterium]
MTSAANGGTGADDTEPVDAGARGGPDMPAAGGPAAALALAALGVVYGDIGTSPLYAFRESFTGHGHELAVSDANVLGVLSLIFWSLIVIISVKYLAFVMRADNDGEGGILALTSLVTPEGVTAGRRRWLLVLIGIFGTALLYGDGMITPAISVLSAVEGTEVATEAFERWVLPLAVVILVGLFVIQRRGTASIGRLFGPVMVVWFGTLAVLGLVQIVDHPGIFRALDPLRGAEFFAHNGFTGFLALGSVFLVVTGGEALYADMGHFGRRPIALGWFSFVLPALLLNYFGQGAMLLGDPGAVENPFYRLAPAWGVLPLVVLATAATVIASQALISGAFSLTMQAVQLGYSPRVEIRHTSPTAFGQIYVPAVNWGLMLACIALVVGFGSSTNLAAAYGVAVTTTMVVTTLLFYVILRERFGWSTGAAGALCAGFLTAELGYFGANLFKVPAGGWFPLVVGAVVFALLTTWRTGRRLLGERIRGGGQPLESFLADLFAERRGAEPVSRVPGTAAFLSSTPALVPPALAANVRYNRVLHATVLTVSVVTDEVPRVPPADRAEVRDLGHGVHQVVLHYGFMEDPDVPTGLTEGAARPLRVRADATTYFLGAESLLVTRRPGMVRWREHLFALMSRNATNAADYFSLPPEATVTVGMRIEL